MRTVPFEPDSVVAFSGKLGYQSAIRFGPDERIENVAVGDSVAWQVTPNKRGDHLFVKPMVAGARSNMTVVTDKRTYLFDLSASPRAQAVYALSFEYPVYPAAGAVQPPPETEVLPPAKVAVAEPKLAPRLNFNWRLRGDKALLPERAFDDGEAIYISWPEGNPLPAVLVPVSGGLEGPVEYRVENGHLVVPGLHRELILRRGKSRVTVSAPKPSRAAVRTATTEVRLGQR